MQAGSAERQMLRRSRPPSATMPAQDISVFNAIKLQKIVGMGHNMLRGPIASRIIHKSGNDAHLSGKT
ncbi:MAG: hypothetical protein ACE5EQ_07630 [Phycisphaerae bacterium]